MLLLPLFFFCEKQCAFSNSAISKSFSVENPKANCDVINAWTKASRSKNDDYSLFIGKVIFFRVKRTEKLSKDGRGKGEPCTYECSSRFS